MERLTISLPEEVAKRLKREARRRHMPVSALVRAAIDGALSSPAKPRRLGFAAIGRSGRRDTSRRVDQILADEWTVDRDR